MLLVSMRKNYAYHAGASSVEFNFLGAKLVCRFVIRIASVPLDPNDVDPVAIHRVPKLNE